MEKKERETRTCFKCEKKRHIAKDCKEKQKIKICKTQEEESDEEDKNNKEQGFGDDLE